MKLIKTLNSNLLALNYKNKPFRIWIKCLMMLPKLNRYANKLTAKKCNINFCRAECAVLVYQSEYMKHYYFNKLVNS